MAPVTRGNSLYTVVENTSGGWGANGWTNTREKAKAIGGDLVVFETRAEQDDVYALLPYIPGGGQGLAIGMTISNGTATWISGSSPNYSHWGDWNPSNTRNGYVGITADYSGGGERFWDASKDGSWGWNGLAEIPFIRRGDSAYVIVQGPTWEEAEANAVKLGGHLVTINDESENQWLAANFKDANKGYNNNADVDIYWTGLEKSSGSWRWTSGEAVSYVNWGPLEPFEDNGRGDRAEIIVQAYPGAAAWTINAGNWNNAPNTYNRYGIAEIKLSSAPPAPTYSLSTSTPVIGEGESFSTNVSTTNVAAGTSLFYSLSGNGITAADFTPGGLSGSGTVGADGKFSFSKTLANDLTTEGTETLTIRLFTDNNLSQQVGNAASVTVYDTSTTPQAAVDIGGNNNGIANNGVLTNNGNINQFSNNGPVNTGTITSNSNNGNTINSNNNSGNTFTTNSNNGNTVNSNNGNTTTVVNNYYTIINSSINSNNQTTNTNSGNIGSTIGSFNTQNLINQTYVSKNSTDYKIVRIADNRYGIKLPDSNTVDEITGQRYVPFADKALDVQKDVKGVFDQVTGKETSNAKMFRLYNAAFARTPDADGLRYWINQFSAGTIDYKRVAQSFLDSNEFGSKYGVANSNNDFVNNLYRNILGRSADQSGLQYWVNNLNQGINSRADVLGGFSESLENKNLFSQTTGFN